MESKGSLPCSQLPATGLYPCSESDKAGRHISFLFVEVPF